MDKDSHLYYNELAKKAISSNDFKKAKEYLIKALSLNPSSFEALFNLAAISFLEREYKEAIKLFEKALRLKPSSSEVYYNIALIYQEINEFKKAEKYYKQALKLNPNDVNILYNLSFIYLTKGDYKKGFEYYRFRYHPSLLKRQTFIPSFEKLLTKGVDFRDKRLFVYREQGLGDMIQFIRFLPFFQKEAKEILAFMPKSLNRLFSYNYPGISFVDDDKDIDFDYHFPLMESAYILGIDKDNIPYKEGYLKVDPKDSEDFKNRYIKTDKKRVGVVWRTNLSDKNDIMTKIRSKEKREVSLENLLNFLKDLDISIYSLQKEESGEEKRLLESFGAISLDETLKDFYDTALAIDNLDLVITIDTSVVHLSGAMGKKTLLLSPFNNDWRWGEDEKRSSWYESVYIFKQDQNGSWEKALKEIKNFV